MLQRIEMAGNEVPTYLTCVNTWANLLQSGGKHAETVPADIVRQSLQFLNRAKVNANEAGVFMEIVQTLRGMLEPPAPAKEEKKPEPELLEEKDPKKKKAVKKPAKKAAKKKAVKK
jgi:hypothetical protein